MAIDPRIALTGVPVQIDSPLDRAARVQKLHGMTNENKLADLTYNSKISEIEQGNALSRAYKAATNADGTVDRAKFRSALVAEGQGSAITGANKAFAEEDEAATKAEAAQVDAALKNWTITSQALSGAVDQATYDLARQQIAGINPQAAANLPATFDTASHQVLMQRGIPIKEQLEQKRAELAAKQAAEKAARDQQNAEANRSVVIRGQDMASRDRQAALEQKANAPKSRVTLSATAQKELFEADDTVQSSKAVIGLLDQASKLNDTAYSGYGAAERAKLRSNLPGESAEANATIDLNNIITGQALESLKAVFGGMPTEGERAILMEMQASVDKTPAQRAAIITRARAAAERRLKFNADKAKGLRDGTYMTDGPVEMDSGSAEDVFGSADAILGGM